VTPKDYCRSLCRAALCVPAHRRSLGRRSRERRGGGLITDFVDFTDALTSSTSSHPQESFRSRVSHSRRDWRRRFSTTQRSYSSRTIQENQRSASNTCRCSGGVSLCAFRNFRLGNPCPEALRALVPPPKRLNVYTLQVNRSRDIPPQNLWDPLLRAVRSVQPAPDCSGFGPYRRFPLVRHSGRNSSIIQNGHQGTSSLGEIQIRWPMIDCHRDCGCNRILHVVCSSMDSRILNLVTLHSASKCQPALVFNASL